jgi:hypothetical protein
LLTRSNTDFEFESDEQRSFTENTKNDSVFNAVVFIVAANFRLLRSRVATEHHGLARG